MTTKLQEKLKAKNLTDSEIAIFEKICYGTEISHLEYLTSKEDMANLKGELKKDIDNLKGELKKNITRLDDEIDMIKDRFRPIYMTMAIMGVGFGGIFALLAAIISKL